MKNDEKEIVGHDEEITDIPTKTMKWTKMLVMEFCWLLQGIIH